MVRPGGPRAGLGAGLVFLAAFAFFWLGMSADVNPYDEGLVLLGADRFAHGGFPHRDFWTLYVPGQYGALAALFSVFGPSILVGRIWDLVLRATAVALVWGLTRDQDRVSAAFATLLCAGWLWTVEFHGYPGIPALVAVLAAMVTFRTYLRRESFRSLVATGAWLGAAAWFRHDFLVAAVPFAAALGWPRGDRPRARSPRREIGLLATGLAATTLPFLAVLLLSVPAGALWEQLVRFPAAVYPSVRGLPFPTPFGASAPGAGPGVLQAVRDVLVVAPFWAVPAVVVCLAWGFRRGWKDTGDRAGAVLLGGLIGVFLLKGLVRPSYVQFVHVFVLAVLGGLFVHARARTSTGLRAVAWLCLLALAVPPARAIRGGYPRGVRETSVPGTGRASGFALPPDQAAALRFIDEATDPDEPIYVGTARHDHAHINDVMFYFLAGRPVPTRFHELHPGVTDRPDVQRRMIDALDGAGVEWVVLWEGDDPRPRAASVGDTPLDDHLRTRFATVARFGAYEILRRLEGDAPGASGGH